MKIRKRLLFPVISPLIVLPMIVVSCGKSESNIKQPVHQFHIASQEEKEFWNLWLDPSKQYLSKPSTWNDKYSSIPEGYQIPDSVHYIGNDCFKNLTLPVGFTLEHLNLKEIGDFAFQNSIINEGFSISTSVENIGNGAFKDASLPKNFTLEKLNFTQLKPGVFDGAKLSLGFKLPNAMIELWDGAFNNAILPQDFTLSNTKITKIPANSFLGADLPFKFTLENTKITSIGDGAFSNVRFPSDFKLPQSLEEIKSNAFMHATFDNLTLPNNLKKIGLNAFKSVIFLGKFSLSNLNMNELPDGLLDNTILPSSFELPRGVRILNHSFRNAKFSSDFKLPNSVESIGSNWIYMCEKQGISLENTNITQLDYEIKQNGVQLREINKNFKLPNKLVRLSSHAFENAILPEGFTISNTKIDGIGLSDFAQDDTKYIHNPYTMPKSFRLPNTIITLMPNAFECVSLPEGFTLPESVKWINSDAFYLVHLPIGFKIPLTTNVDVAAFIEPKIPAGAHWYDKNHIQNNVIGPGSYIA